MNSEDRNAISRFIHDLISWLKARLKGEKVSYKIIELENRFAAVLRNVDTNAQKNNTTNDGDVHMSKKLPGEYAYPHTTLDNNSNEYRAKMKAITELDNLLATAKEHYYSDDTKGNPEATLVWDYYEVEFLCDGMQVSGLINIANSENGRAFYDMTKIKVASAISEKYVALLARSPFTSQKATNNKVSQKDKVVNTHYTQESENYSSPEQDNDGGILYSFGDIDVYDEAQYNDFGWVRYNDVLSASEYSTLLSRYADYKHNKHNYPTTRFGEAVIHSSELPDVIMYVKGSIVSPQITKAVRIETDSYTASSIKGWILQNEYRQVSQPYSAIESLYGQEVLSICRKRDYEPFWEYQARTKRNGSPTSDTISGTEQDGTGSTQQNKTTDKAGLDNSAFSMPENDIRYSFEDDVASLTEQDKMEKYPKVNISTSCKV